MTLYPRSGRLGTVSIWCLTSAGRLCLQCETGPVSVPDMTQNNHSLKHEEQMKFLAPRVLKQQLEALARERNISLSALMRLIASEYVKRTRIP